MRKSRKERAGLVLAAALLWAGCDSPSGSGVGPPAQLTVLSGDLQTAPAGEELPQPLVVKVTDADGDPVRNQVVNFVVTAGGGSVFAGTAQTDKDGEARERWTLGFTLADTQRVEARAVNPSTGAALVFGQFRAVAGVGAVATLAAVGGDRQTGLVTRPLTQPLQVRVTDGGGNPVSGATVTWTGPGTFTPAQSVVGADGIAQTTWTLGTAAGALTATATSGTRSVQLTAEAGTGPQIAGRLVVTPETGTGVVGGSTTQFASVWQDVYGNASPVYGAAWSWLRHAVVAGPSAPGQFDAVGVGTTQVVATIGTPGGVSADTVTVTVTPGPGYTLQQGVSAPSVRTAGGASGSDFWLGGEQGILVRSTGGEATAPARWTTLQVNGLWGPAADDVYAVGADGLILHYDGTTWRGEDSGTGQALYSVSGSTASDVWAVGAGGTILRNTGSGWSPVASPTTGSISHVWVAPTGEVFLAAGNTLYRRIAGGGWAADPLSTFVLNLQGESATHVIASSAGKLYRWNGSAWSEVPGFQVTVNGSTRTAALFSGAPSGGYVYAIATYVCEGSRDCYVLHRRSGTQWETVRTMAVMQSSGTPHPVHLWRLNDGALIASGTQGTWSVAAPAPAPFALRARRGR